MGPHDFLIRIILWVESKINQMNFLYRTEDPPAAKELLGVLDIDKYFSYKEIYPGSKVSHFKK